MWKLIGYNVGIDNDAKSKFGTHKELIVLNILKYKYCVNQSHDMSRDQFAKNPKLLTNWLPVSKKKSTDSIYPIYITYF